MGSVVRPLGRGTYIKPTNSQPNNRSHWGHYQPLFVFVEFQDY